MDRRTFARALSAAGLGLLGCGRDGGPVEPVQPEPPLQPPPVTPPPPPPPPDLHTARERAFSAVAGLMAAAEPYGDAVRWRVRQEVHGYRTDLYSGQAGIVTFLAEAHRLQPSAELRSLVERGGRYLLQAPPMPSQSLFEGNAGTAWALLTLHDVLGDRVWLDAALARTPAIANATGTFSGDLIAGASGQGLYLLRLHERTSDPQWLTAARRLADGMLARAVPAEGGIKFPSFVLQDGRTVFYTGLSHGAAGAGYFLCRLAGALPGAERAAYTDGAEAAAAWLKAIAISEGTAVNWYRREPDQLGVRQIQWCHGAPGIGIFYAELHRVTGSAAHLDMAKRAALTVEHGGVQHGFSALCHGVAGNASLFIKLLRETGDPAWLAKANGFGEEVWSRRLQNTAHAAWSSADGFNTNNPGLLNGTAGPAWFFLQLAQDGRLGFPVTD